MRNIFLLNDIYISIYSFGYSANFIKDDRRGSEYNILTPEELIDICHKYAFSGIELPIDRYCPSFDSKQISLLFDNIFNNKLGIKIDFENISTDYTKNIIPILKDYGIEYFRTKVSNFFGCNRYNHPEFKVHFENFIEYVNDILPILKKYDISVLVENHQDIIIDDYYRLWEIFPKEFVGVNWDTGNSIPALESPNSFLNKMYPFIGNIHLKDYKIYQTENGYKLTRCPLGDGVVDFSNIFSFFEEKKLKIPMTIELGAMISRISDIYLDKFWEALPEVNESRKIEFIKYIETNFQNIDNDQTLWEKKSQPDKILLSEIDDLEASVNYLKKL